MMVQKILIKNERATLALAKKISRGLKGGDILLLQGELGSGKTTFVQGLAQALGVREKIKSPTFVLVHQHRVTSYKLRVTRFVHCDAYRVKNARELKETGLADWLGRPDTVTVVEWGEKIKPLVKGKVYRLIKFKHGKKPNERMIMANF